MVRMVARARKRASAHFVPVAVTLLLALSAAAAEPHGFAQTRHDAFDILSGRTTLETQGPGGSTAFYDATGLTFTGMTRACTQAGCATGEALRLLVMPGSSVVLDPHGHAQVHASADHALTTFMDLSSEPDIPGDTGPSVLMAAIGAQASFEATPQTDMPVVPVGRGSVAMLYDGPILTARLAEDEPIFLTGPVQATTFDVGMVVAPFTLGSGVEVTAASPAAAKAGLSQAHLEQIQQHIDAFDLLAGLEVALQGSLGAYRELVDDILNAASLRADPARTAPTLDDIDLHRYESLHVAATTSGTWWIGEEVFADGQPTPAYDAGVEAHPTAAWILAIIAVAFASLGLLARIVQDRSGRHRLIALAATGGTIAAAALVFVMWDAQFAHGIGTSAMTSDAETSTTGLLLLGQIVLLLGAVALVAVPTGWVAYRATRHDARRHLRPVAAVLGLLASYLVALLYIHHFVGWLLAAA